MVSMEAWGYQSFGLDIQAGTEILRWCVVSFGWGLYRTQAWRDMAASPLGCLARFGGRYRNTCVIARLGTRRVNYRKVAELLLGTRYEVN